MKDLNLESFFFYTHAYIHHLDFKKNSQKRSVSYINAIYNQLC